MKNKEKLKRVDIAGFTLLELLLAVTIFSIIAVVLYSTLYTGITALRKIEKAMKIHQGLRLVTEEMVLDLRNALLAPLYESKFKEVSEITQGKKEPVYFFYGEEKSFSFVTLKDSQICNVTYFLNEKTDPKKFMRILRYQSKGFAKPEGGGEVLLSNVEDMEVKYSYQSEDIDSPPKWLTYWHQEEKIPLGIKIKLELKGLGTLKEITKTVYIPVGELGIEEETEL